MAWFDLTAYKGGHQLGDSREVLFDVLKLLLILVGAVHPKVTALFCLFERGLSFLQSLFEFLALVLAGGEVTVLLFECVDLRLHMPLQVVAKDYKLLLSHVLGSDILNLLDGADNLFLQFFFHCC